MLNCKEITQMTDDHLNHEMGPWKSLKFKMHLMMCEHCRRFVDQVGLVVRLSRAEEAPPDATTVQRLADKFSQEG